MPDPHRILGVEPGSSQEEIAAAYRELAKRLHPDRAGEDPGAVRQMAEINQAYDTVLRGHARPAPAPAPTRAPGRRPAGWWLDRALRRRLGPELLEALHDGEDVRFATPVSTWASPSSLLVLTDRRLLWLGEDAVLGRVRELRLREVAQVAVRRAWPRRRSAMLSVRMSLGHRHTFAGLPPDLAQRLADAIRAGALR